MKLKSHSRKCCGNPDVKNEGYVKGEKGISWEYHCYNCNLTWNEIVPAKTASKKKSKISIDN